MRDDIDASEFALVDHEDISGQPTIGPHEGLSTAPRNGSGDVDPFEVVMRHPRRSAVIAKHKCSFFCHRLRGPRVWQVPQRFSHAGEHAGPELGPSSLPSEAAWLAEPNSSAVTPPEVHVFVPKSSLKTMRTVHKPLGDAVIVEPLTFSETQLDAQAFLPMMAVGSSDWTPLAFFGS
ncbi:hypothetical protein LshimejAT787_0105560 [Lyophyllum shimeji]|uniref:Uncharacterized protein n=1 Tax=Lyophyllum shimeji TaxID=47721 RepID=A0A9P3UI34_LYOSH|nr:hypothetical protein LshimejAT787_0105560 [Lyophyllum shimeji]